VFTGIFILPKFDSGVNLVRTVAYNDELMLKVVML